MSKEDVSHTYTHTHTQEYCLGVRKKEVLPFVTTWIVLGHVMLSEVSLIDKDE